MGNSLQAHDDEIDLKALFKILVKYKLSIILISLTFFIGSAILAYYKPNIYSSNSLVEILSNESSNVDSTDFMLKALGGSTTNLDNDISLLKSRFTIQKALETLNLTTSYYSYNSIGKKTELYKDSPFIISLESIEDIIYEKDIKLIPIDNDHFILQIDPVSDFSQKGILALLGVKPLTQSDRIHYKKIHKYGEKITSPWFTVTINKMSNLNAPKYSFNILHKNKLYDKFAGALSVSLGSGSASILTLSYKDYVSLRAKDILHAITMQYIRQGIEEKTKTAELTLSFIDSQLEKIDTKLTASEQDLKNYKVTNKVINLSNKASLATSQVSEYEVEQLQLQTEINILTNLKYFIDNNSDLDGLTLGTIKFSAQNLVMLVQSLQEMTEKKNLLLVDYTELYPEVIKLTRSISNTKKSIKQAVSNSLEQLEQRNSDLNQIIAKYHESLSSLPVQERELAELARPLKVNENVYEYLLQKKAETAILKSSTLANARIIDPARDEIYPIEPNRKAEAILGLFLGFMIGVILAFIREFLITTVQNSSEIEKATSLPIYGVIPLNTSKTNKVVYKESYKNIRTNLQFLPGNEKNKIISITSSVSGEGKTTITATLAEVLAQGNKKVLILDLDMRKASLHKYFNLNNDLGMSNFLTEQNTFEEVVKPSVVQGVDIITTGPLPPNPSELILSSTFTALLEVAKEEYDYVVIDTPPAGLVTDAVIIMNYSDISFIVVRANYTRKEFLSNIEKMAQDNSHNRLGIIFNAATTGSSYGYGSNYAYGYGNSQYYLERS